MPPLADPSAGRRTSILHRDLAPGEVPRTPGAVWLVLIVALAGLALLLRHLFARPG